MLPVLQTPNEQMEPNAQLAHMPALEPHAVVELPAWHSSFASQHPKQVVGVHFDFGVPHDASGTKSSTTEETAARSHNR